MAIAYYGVALPDKKNWVETPEGYLIFKNAVIGRTGFQTYKGAELDENELMEQGVKVGADDDVELYRDAEEVFSPQTLASFVGKSVTEGHPSELLSVENVKDHEQGQVLNVRQGKEALESGDYPLLADLIVKSHNLIGKIKAGLRELSCGYNYHVQKDGDVLKQVDIIGNHVAVVENARAGREAVIVDSVPEILVERINIMDLLATVFGVNRKAKLAAWAKDAKPEEIAEAFEAIGKEVETRPDVVTTVKAKVTPRKPATATDEGAIDRKRFHDALDRVFDAQEQKKEAEDADIAALADMFAKHSSQDAAVDEEEEKKEGGDEAADGEEEENEEGEDEGKDQEGALTIEPSDRPKSAGPGTDAIHAARVEGARAILKALKPLVAQSGNTKLIGAFDTAAKAVQGKSTGKTTGGYGKFVEASQRRSKAASDSVNDADRNKKAIEQISGYEKAYAERFNVVKR